MAKVLGDLIFSLGAGDKARVDRVDLDEFA